jgi:flagellar hook protein FlgE
MSINSAMLSGVSGLIANSSALAAISDNIANVNTVGYKRTQANFSTLVTSQSKNSTYSAGGVKSLTHQFVTQQGLTQSTTSNLDLSIAGAGFFVGTEKPEGLTATDTRSFTRAGSFQLDNLGYLKNDAGLYLQGWLADPVTGDITPDPSDLTQLDSINVGTVGGTAEKTTRAAVNANLRSAQPISPQVKFVMTKASVAELPSGSGSYTVAYSKTATAGVYDVEVRKGNLLIGTGTGDYCRARWRPAPAFWPPTRWTPAAPARARPRSPSPVSASAPTSTCQRATSTTPAPIRCPTTPWIR